MDVDPAHLDRPFDYRIPDDVDVAVGQRVKVRFAGRTRPGWVIGTAATTQVEPDRLLDLAPWGDTTWFDADDLRFFRWVAQRYAAPLVHVLRHALPKRVAAVEKDLAAREAAGVRAPGRPRRSEGAAAGGAGPGPGIPDAWRSYDAEPLLNAITAMATAPAGGTAPPPAFWWRALPDENPGDMIVGLLQATLDAGRGAVVVAPDPRSPLLAAVQSSFGAAVADHRSARDDRTRYRAFLRGRSGDATVAIGERSGVFAPVADLGLIVVDDEASAVYKEQRSPRHHVREVALARARFSNAVCLLTSDLPSAAAWRLVEAGHVRRIAPVRAAERTRRPRVDVVDLGSPRPGVRRARLSTLANRGLGEVVARGGRAVVLAARGGISAALACTRCGQRRECPACAGSLRPLAVTPRIGGDPADPFGAGAGRWECPGCGWQGASFPCEVCAAERTAPLAAGAQRLAAELARGHPEAEVVTMEGFNAPGPESAPAIAVMTRGSVVDDPVWLNGHRADVIVAPDADGMLARPSVEAAEDTLRLWYAAARLAGRMIVQTREPNHHAVQALVRWDPEGFWTAEAPRRSQLGFPPARSLIKVTSAPEQAAAVAGELRDVLPDGDEVLGPTAEGACLVKVAHPRDTIPIIYELRQTWDQAGRGVRVDVDPIGDH